MYGCTQRSSLLSPYHHNYSQLQELRAWHPRPTNKSRTAYKHGVSLVYTGVRPLRYCYVFAEVVSHVRCLVQSLPQ
jgi:hypothetical protein